MARVKVIVKVRFYDTVCPFTATLVFLAACCVVIYYRFSTIIRTLARQKFVYF